MNKKSILYIFVVLMALSLTLSAVSAEDVAADVADVADEAVIEEAPADEGAAGGDEEVVLTEPAATPAAGSINILDVPIADVETDVQVVEENPYEIIWSVVAANNGPDTAYDTYVAISGSDSLMVYQYLATNGNDNLGYDPVDDVFLWYVGDLLPNQVEVLLLDTIKMDEGPYYVDALISTTSVDYDLSNNYDIVWADVPEESAAEKTMPAAGNPIAMALLALVAIVGTTISRRF